jgi:alpha-tubulin suppressor-like RCC1 family protein
VDEIYCWGKNNFGQLGIGTSTAFDVIVPPSKVESGHRFMSVSAGNGSTCALTSDGEAECWGLIGEPLDSCPKIANCSMVPRLVPTTIRFVQIEAKTFSACAIGVDGHGYCWGSGNTLAGSWSDMTIPAQVQYGSLLRSLSSGSGLCAIDINQRALCWGANSSGSTGNGTLRSNWMPASVEGPFDN